jgi:hypothetical protein
VAIDSPKEQTQPAARRVAPVAPRRPQVHYIVRRTAGPWKFVFLALLTVGAAGALYLSGFLEQTTDGSDTLAQETQVREELVPEIVELPPIVANPEKDGILPPDVRVTDEGGNMDPTEDQDGKQPPPMKPVVKKPDPPKKNIKPGTLVKSIILNEVPDEHFIPADRIVDIMILYTKAVKTKWGGPDKVLEHANDVVAYANFKFHEKNAKGRLRLVGLVEVNYTAADDLKADIGNLSRGRITSGRDNVHALRKKTGADLVCLFSSANSRGGGGLAQIKGPWAAMNFPVRAIFKHEMQHNFGWNHGDRNDLSMIHKNFPEVAKWERKMISKGKLFIQYVSDGE